MQIKGLEILIYLAVLILEAGAIACFVGWLHWCMGSPGGIKVNQGLIFSRYGNWLHKNYGFIETLKAEGHHKGLNWYKPLGHCIYCMSVWISYIAFVVLKLLHLHYTITSYPIIENAILFIVVFPALVNMILIKIRSHG